MTIHAYSKLILLCLVISACATGSKVEGLEYSILSIKKAVEKHLPGPLHSLSENGRVYKTKAFRLPLYYQTKVYKTKGLLPERAYAKIAILGDRRPYTLAVEIEIEELMGMQNGKPRYQVCCRHREYEKNLAKEIKDYLVKRKDNQDLIDDFRPF
tara:strand:- start:9132 stop:9596 length:465 start_codon:yes stop_codon:yes gene_type:complete